MSKLLLTAFEAFGGESINPAQAAMERLDCRNAFKLLIPVEYGVAAKCAIEAIQACRPDAVICLGQAGGRTGITPEKYAVNLRSSTAPDSAGRVFSGEPVVAGGAERLESTFGAEEIAAALIAAGLPAYVSHSAGTYVCNDVMYAVLDHLKGSHIPAGFIHLPYCIQQLKGHPGCFAMEVDQIARAIEIAIKDIGIRYEL